MVEFWKYFNGGWGRFLVENIDLGVVSIDDNSSHKSALEHLGRNMGVKERGLGMDCLYTLKLRCSF